MPARDEACGRQSRVEFKISCSRMWQSISRLRHLLVVGVLVLGLQGCATVRGSQHRPEVLDPATSKPQVGTIDRIDIAISKFYGDAAGREGKSQFAYRNAMIVTYSSLIEEDYWSFKDQLYAGNRGTGLGFDLVQLGFIGATGLAAKSAVDELTTISAVLAGARASVDKRLFFDRTIDALVASMDAERLNIRADIARKRRLPANEYTLDDAVDDLNRLIEAGNINRAFTRLTRNAEDERKIADVRLSNISEACADINEDDAVLVAEFREFIRGSTANLSAAISAMSAPSHSSDLFLLEKFVTEYCGNEAKRALLEKLKGPA